MANDLFIKDGNNFGYIHVGSFKTTALAIQQGQELAGYGNFYIENETEPSWKPERKSKRKNNNKILKKLLFDL